MPTDAVIECVKGDIRRQPDVDVVVNAAEWCLRAAVAIEVRQAESGRARAPLGEENGQVGTPDSSGFRITKFVEGLVDLKTAFMRLIRGMVR